MIETINPEYVSSVIVDRPSNVHKHQCGKILVIGGFHGMAGAGIMTSFAALRSGAGIVKLCCNRDEFSVANTVVPEVITIKWDKVVKDLQTFDTVAIGPGAGRTGNTALMLDFVLRNSEKTVIIDADGLNVISDKEGMQNLVRKNGDRIIMTPHHGEADRLLGIENEDRLSREETIKRLVEEYESTVVLKGEGSLVAGIKDGDMKIMKNTTGNAGMATAGSGDVLTGVVAAFTGMGMKPFEATAAAVHVHGLAGDMALKKKGEFGMISRDIIHQLPYAIMEVRGK